MSYTLSTAIIINAPSQRIYNHLTNLKSYSKWNPFIIESQIISDHKQLEVGAKLQNVLLTDADQGKKMTFKPIVTRLEMNKEFEWLGSLGMRYIFDGRHNFKLNAINENQTELVHSERFTGTLIFLFYPLLGILMMNKTKNNFNLMNNALKQVAENP